MNYLLSLILIVSSFIAGAQEYLATDNSIKYRIWNQDKFRSLLQEGKRQTALKYFLEEQATAVQEKNLAFLWQAEEFLAELLEPESGQDVFLTLHKQWNESNGPARNVLAKSLSALYWTLEYSGNFSFDDESWTWPNGEANIRLTNNNSRPLLDLYQRALFENEHTLTQIPALAIDKNATKEKPTLLDLLFEREQDQTRFYEYETYFTASSQMLLSDKNPAVERQGKLEIFHKKQGNWPAYRQYVLQRAKNASNNLELLKRINGFDTWSKEFSSSVDQNYFIHEIAYLYAEEANRYHPIQKTDVKNYNIEALQRIDKALSTWPLGMPKSDSLITNQLLGLKGQIQAVSIDFSWPISPLLKQDNLTRISYKNCKKAHLLVAYISDKEVISKLYNNLGSPITLNTIQRKTIDLTDLNLNLNHSFDFVSNNFEKAGLYLVAISHESTKLEELLKSTQWNSVKQVNWKIIEISDLNVESMVNQEETLVYVSSLKTGKAIQNAKVYYSSNPKEKNVSRFVKTNKNGIARILNSSRSNIKVIYGLDSIESYVYGNPRQVTLTSTSKIYLDRGIYRPGQKVEMRLLSLTRVGYDWSVSGPSSKTVSIRDENNTEIFSQQVNLNQMGTAYASFMLPKSKLPGYMSVLVDNQYLESFRIEEYKLPTFKIEWLPTTGLTKLNEIVILKGNVKAYAGFPLSNTEVEVQISENRYFPRYCFIGPEFMRYDTTIRVKTDGAGNFKIQYISQKPKETSGIYLNFEAKVVNSTGETQFASTSQFIGKQGFEINVIVKEQISKGEGESLGFQLVNSSNTEIPAKLLELKIYKKQPTDFYLRTIEKAEFTTITKKALKSSLKYVNYGREETINDLVYKGNIISSGTIKLDSLNLEAGTYIIEAQTKDDLGDTITIRANFAMIDWKTKKMQHHSALFVEQNKKEYQQGETAEILMGSTLKKLSIFYTIQKANGEIKLEHFALKGRKKLEFTLDTSCAEGVSLRWSSSFQDQKFTQEVYIRPLSNDPKLIWKWIRKTDKTKPGNQENWEFSVSDEKGLGMEGEAAVGLYDKSLDNFAQNTWELPNLTSNWQANYWQPFYHNTQRFFSNGYYNETYQRVYGNTFIRGDVMSMPNKTNAAAMVGLDKVEFKGTFAEESNEPTPPNKVRSNFSETALFLPQLEIKNGKGEFGFKVPDALTTFGFKGIFHTTDANFIKTESELLVQKELLIETYEPRFLRTNDVLEWKIVVQNLTSSLQEVEPSLIFKDTEGKDISNLFGVVHPTKVQVNSNSSVTIIFKLTVPNIPMEEVQFTIGVASDRYGDFVQKSIPIQTNLAAYDYNESFIIQANSSSSLPWDFNAKVPASANLQQAKINIFANEELLFFKDLSQLFFRKNELNEGYMGQYFAIELAESLLQNNPDLKNTLENQLRKKQAKGTLVENWSTEQLSLSPWFEEAQDEHNYFQSTALLLDDQAMKNYKNQAITNLLESQLENGAWSWVGKDQPNVWVTLDFLNQLAILKTKGIDNLSEQANTALAYVESHFEELYNKFSKEQRLNGEGLNSMSIQWLWVRNVYNLESNVVSNYFLDLARNNWSKTGLENWPKLGWLAHQIGDTKWSKLLFEALEDNRITKPKQGSYWNFSNGSKYDQNTGLSSHILAIGFYEKLGLSTEVAKLRQWLVLNKRANQWSNRQTNSLACAILLNGFKAQSMNVEIGWIGETTQVVRDQEIEIISKNPTRNSIKAGAQSRNNSNQAVYVDLNLNYIAPVKEVIKSNGDLRIEKQYYLIKDGVETQLSQKAASSIQVGDRLKVVLKIISPLAYDYLLLEDPKFSGQEPILNSSGYRSESLSYYAALRDQKSTFFIEHLPKGTHQISYEFIATLSGQIQVPASTLVSYYQPEKTANSSGFAWIIK